MGNGNRGNIMIIKNGLVFTPEGKFEKKDLYVEGEYVAKETTDNKEVEAEGCQNDSRSGLEQESSYILYFVSS